LYVWQKPLSSHAAGGVLFVPPKSIAAGRHDQITSICHACGKRDGVSAGDRGRSPLQDGDAEKWAPGAYVKIGKFANDTDLVYQHEIHGSLISLPDKVMEVVYLNYFKGIISYNGIQRVETYPVPHAAFREAITNAIAHRDYSTGIPIQIVGCNRYNETSH
jgi:hypothetical protein